MSVADLRNPGRYSENVMPPSNNGCAPEMNCLGNRSYQNDF